MLPCIFLKHFLAHKFSEYYEIDFYGLQINELIGTIYILINFIFATKKETIAQLLTPL